MKTDENGFVIARATVVEFTPSSGVTTTAPRRLAFDVSHLDGGGRYMVDHRDERAASAKLWEGVTVRFHPQDQFARIVQCEACDGTGTDTDLDEVYTGNCLECDGTGEVSP